MLAGGWLQGLYNMPLGCCPAHDRHGPTRWDATERTAVSAAWRALAELPTLNPPRKHYHLHYSTREADGNMRNCPQGIHAFLRAYYHYKSVDWQENRPHKLQSWTASELAKLPTYYLMDLDKGMAETVAPHMPTKAEVAAYFGEAWKRYFPSPGPKPVTPVTGGQEPEE
jgi:hypothetical protein